jgi:hypothetical protein
MKSHFGKLGGNNQETRLYDVLKSSPGKWFDGLYLSQKVRTIALHSCAHGCRQQLPPGEVLENKVLYRPALRRRESYYRLTTTQMELNLTAR